MADLIVEDSKDIRKFFETVAVDEYADWVIAEIKRTLPAGFDSV
jgi:hypothetical protein